MEISRILVKSESEIAAEQLLIEALSNEDPNESIDFLNMSKTYYMMTKQYYKELGNILFMKFMELNEARIYSILSILYKNKIFYH